VFPSWATTKAERDCYDTEQDRYLPFFNRNGDDIFSDSTRELGNPVKDACEAMMKAKK
jgi:hypothetical protein